MSKKDMPMGISLFLVLFLLFEVYYFFVDFLFVGLYPYHGYTLDSLSYLPYLCVLLFVYIFVVFALYKITQGFIFREDWARKFAIVFSVIASVFAIWGIIIGNRVFENIIFFALYVLIILYLMSEYVKKYFEEAMIFTYGPYTLYTRKVHLVNVDRIVDIYFFSTHQPKSGTPCAMPEGYEVGINPRTKMPYLRKKDKKPVKTVELVEVEKPEAKDEDSSRKKPSNVIYVVSKPQPGEVRGDWAVRSHGKIYSHHKTQENAIKAARKIAKQKNATVMIQATDGKFREGFKPKK